MEDAHPGGLGQALRVNGLRVALFSGNYNCVRDGANQALNRLVAFLEDVGATVQVFSPTCDEPAFEPAGTLTSVPSIPIPRRPEYRLASPLTRDIKAQLKAFQPDVIHISAPDILGCSAVNLARKWGIPAVASVHTRFETYLQYYGLAALEGLAQRYMSWLYNRCQQVYVPSQCMADILTNAGVRSDIRRWTRGVEHDVFNPGRRDLEWRRSFGIEDDEVVISFVGRVVMEKGLEPFAAAIDGLEDKGLKFRPLVVGDGPARPWFEARLPKGIFTGALYRADLARAFASSDIFFNPSVTEAFGNVNLEAIASGVPVVSARASGNSSIVEDGVTGVLVDPKGENGFASALEDLIRNPEKRAALGRNGVAASQRYHWNEILSEVAGHYLSAIALHPSRPMEAPALRGFFPKFFEGSTGVSK